jgi:hypothetical protein
MWGREKGKGEYLIAQAIMRNKGKAHGIIGNNRTLIYQYQRRKYNDSFPS